MSKTSTSSNLFGNSDSVSFTSNNPFESVAAERVVESVPQALAMVASGPAVDASEVENAAVTAVEVRVLWGSNILHVAHLTEARAFVVGETGDFVMSAEKLGSASAEIVSIVDGQPCAMILAGATAQITIDGVGDISVEQAVATGVAVVSGRDELRVALRRGVKVRSERAGLVFQVASVAAGKVTKGSFFSRAARPALLMGAVSLLAHVGIMAGLAFFKPVLDVDNDDAIRAENQMMMKQFLKASAVREEERRNEIDNTAASDAGAPGSGSSTKSDAQKASQSNAKTGSWAKGATTIPGGTTGSDSPMSAREEMLRTGMIAALSRQGSLLQTSTAWNADLGGPDGDSMFMRPGDTTNLSLSGDPDGNQGNEAIHGNGPGDNFSKIPGDKLPKAGDRAIKGEHVPGNITSGTPVPSRRDATVSPELIQRLIRQNRGRFAACYEDGLRRNPTLSGRVTLSFTIGSDGSVKTASAGGDVGDSAVTSCMSRAVYGLSFPSTEGGVIRVSYPMVLSPAN